MTLPSSIATKRKVKDLTPGDMIDLQGDKYADPNRTNVTYEFEYALVGERQYEGDECLVLYIEGVDAIGFPPDHEVPWHGHDMGYDT